MACLHTRKGPPAFMIPDGSLNLLKTVCAVWFDLNMAAAVIPAAHTSETHHSQKQPQEMFAEMVDIDKHMGGGIA